MVAGEAVTTGSPMLTPSGSASSASGSAKTGCGVSPNSIPEYQRFVGAGRSGATRAGPTSPRTAGNVEVADGPALRCVAADPGPPRRHRGPGRLLAGRRAADRAPRRWRARRPSRSLRARPPHRSPRSSPPRPHRWLAGVSSPVTADPSVVMRPSFGQSDLDVDRCPGREERVVRQFVRRRGDAGRGPVPAGAHAHPGDGGGHLIVVRQRHRDGASRPDLGVLLGGQQEPGLDVRGAPSRGPAPGRCRPG